MTEGNEPEDADRKEYLEERRLLIDAEGESAASFDKAMITLSAGALGLSVTFIRQVVPQPRQTCLLLGAWIAYVGALLTVLVSFLLTQAAMRRQQKIIDTRETRRATGAGDSRLDDERNFASAWAVSLSIASIVLFAVGTILLVGFCFVNLGR
ncbi:MAG: hypothetical protein ACHQQS_07815 [Thermoanaerobaculales bacterium]